jgi:thioredoxin
MTNTNLTVTDATFNADVLQSATPVLVDFWADWCGPCKSIAPVIEEIANDYEGQVKVRKLNVDDSPQAAGNYGIRSIPTLALFHNGEVQETLVGVQPKAKLEQLLKHYIQ